MQATITRNEQFNSFEITFDGKPTESVRDLLKSNGYRWHKARGLWYGYKDIADQLKGADVQNSAPCLEQEQSAKAEQQDDKQRQAELKEIYIGEYKRIFPDTCPRFLEWLLGKIARIIELDGGELLEIEKPSIRTDFCFGYGQNGISTQEDQDRAAGAMNYADTHADYFLRENLEQLTRTVDTIKEYLNSEQPGYCGTIPEMPYLGEHYINDSKIKTLAFMRRWDFENMHPDRKRKYRKPTTEELQRILTAYEIEIKAFEKRLQAYLKRYGLTKLHTWTYLSD